MNAALARAVTVRPLVLLLAVAVLVVLDGAAATPAQGRDLSGVISSTRGGQLTSEASMRAADGNIKSLQRARRKAAKRVRRSGARLERLRDRKAAARARVRTTASALAAARDGLRDRIAERAALVGSGVVPDGVADTAPAAHAGPLVRPVMRPATSGSGQPGASAMEHPDGPALPLTGARTILAGQRTILGSERAILSLEHRVASLEGELKRVEKAARQLERRTRRAFRRERIARHRVSRIRQAISANVGRREGAESSLAYYIRSMTRLAHLRAKKVTKGRDAVSFGWPVPPRVSQGYHGGHDGIDLVAGRGTPIRAMGTGVVAFVGWNPWDEGRRAFVVVLAHQGGYETLYGHLLPIRKVIVGRMVRRGQVIGYMGNTGHSTGVHLHIEVKRGFHTLNPYSVL